MRPLPPPPVIPPVLTPVRRELRCADCNYGAIASQLPPCPMCGGGNWLGLRPAPFERPSVFERRI